MLQRAKLSSRLVVTIAGGSKKNGSDVPLRTASIESKALEFSNVDPTTICKRNGTVIGSRNDIGELEFAVKNQLDFLAENRDSKDSNEVPARLKVYGIPAKAVFVP